MTKKYDQIIYIGRFQPPHKAHLETIELAKTLADEVTVLIGSSNQPRTTKDPFTFEERRDLISHEISYIDILPIEDYRYDDDIWMDQISELSVDGTVGIIGYHKDASSYYLDLFQDYQIIDTGDLCNSIDASDIRKKWFDGEGLGDSVTDYTRALLANFKLTEQYKPLYEEYQYIENYKKSYSQCPFPPIFVTTDCIVKCKDQILLVRRGQDVGIGQLALPGGFVNANERITSAALRELNEETGLVSKVEDIKDHYMFDDPDRSRLGRVITHVFLFELDDCDPVAGDDADEVILMDIEEILNSRDQMFSDHYSIIFNVLRDYDMIGGIE